MKNIIFETKYLKAPHLFYKDFCNKENTILFESAEIVDKSGVQSLIGLSTALKITCDDLKVTVKALNENGTALLKLISDDLNISTCDSSFSICYTRPSKNLDEYSRLKSDGPFSVLRVLQKHIKDCNDIFIGGTIAFDFINNYEYIGDVPKGENPCSDYTFYVFDVSVRVNHIEKTTKVNAYIFAENAYKDTAFTALSIKEALDDFDKEDTLDISFSVKPEITQI